MNKDAVTEKPKAYIGTVDGPARERVEVYAEDSGKFMLFEVEGNVERALF